MPKPMHKNRRARRDARVANLEARIVKRFGQAALDDVPEGRRRSVQDLVNLYVKLERPVLIMQLRTLGADLRLVDHLNNESLKYRIKALQKEAP